MTRVILGIDPGIADTGWGVVELQGSVCKCLGYGSVKTPAGDELVNRLDTLHQELTKIIKKYKPALASVEQLFFAKNAKTALIVGHARGVILLTLRQNKIPLVEFTPLQIKQAIAGYGQADKRQVQKMVKLVLGLTEIPKPDDAADALAAAICATNYKIVK